jgi:bifunctional DNA-binding transcriptional regulator/antitoxin component of YhaV-PrlF toxin-antitoxin module
MKKSWKAIISKSDNAVWGHYVIVPDKIAKSFLSKKIKRVICTINDDLNIHAALMPKKDGQAFININKEIRKKYKLEEGSSLMVEIFEDTSKYGMTFPEEMKELMLQDPEGEAVFHKLTPGKQRSLLYLISKPKTSDSRLKKALVILDYLKATGGQLDFKDLNIAFKESNY